MVAGRRAPARRLTSLSAQRKCFLTHLMMPGRHLPYLSARQNSNLVGRLRFTCMFLKGRLCSALGSSSPVRLLHLPVRFLVAEPPRVVLPLLRLLLALLLLLPPGRKYCPGSSLPFRSFLGIHHEVLINFSALVQWPDTTCLDTLVPLWLGFQPQDSHVRVCPFLTLGPG